MELTQLIYFMEVARLRNISAAAEKLHISQPPLSRQMKTLEKELNCELMIRTTRGIVLTDQGVALFQYGAKILGTYEECIKKIDYINNKSFRKTLIGTNDGAYNLIVSNIVNDFSKNSEKSKIGVLQLVTSDILKCLYDGQIQIGVLRKPIDNIEHFDVIYLTDERWSVIADDNFDYYLSNNTEISIEQLIEYPLILPSRESLYLPIIDEFSKKCNKNINIECYYYELKKAIQLCNKKLGVVIVPSCINRLTNKQSYKLLNIKDFNYSTGYIAIKLKGKNTYETQMVWDFLNNYSINNS